MAAKFEIRSAKAGEFNWVLTSQGRTLATGESYTRKGSAEKAIDSLRKAASTATVADLTLPPAKTAPGTAAVKAATKATKAVKGAKAVKSAKKTAKATKSTKTAKKAASGARKTASSGRKRTAGKKSAAPRKGTSKAG
jgi:uncharacterized protein YegP (UPF0339 family)